MIYKWLIIIGLSIAGLGVILWALSKTGLPFGKLPGDLVVNKGKTTFYFPIITSIAVSVVLTLLINLVLWFFRK